MAIPIPITTQLSKSTYALQGESRQKHKDNEFRKLCNEQGISILTYQPGINIPAHRYISLLQACIRAKSLAEGKGVHAHMIKTGLKFDIFLETILITLYAKSETTLMDARQLFDKLSERNVVSWSTMIAGYNQHKRFGQALLLFYDMQKVGMKPNQFTFGSVLKACAGLENLEMGRLVHACIVKTGLCSNVFAGSALVDMYAKCWNVADAREVFERIHERDMVLWTAIVTGYVQHGESYEALSLFHQMQEAGMKPNQFTFASVLQACADIEALEQGKQIHAWSIKSRYETNVFVASALVDMYTKCKCLVHARQVFDGTPERNSVLWAAMISAYAQLGHCKEAMTLFYQMQRAGMRADEFSFASILTACAGVEGLEQGEQVHAYITKMGFESNVFVGSALVDMYAKCGYLIGARQIFNKMPKRNVISWTAMIAAYAQHHYGEQSLALFYQMQGAGIKPNQVTFASILSVCAKLAMLEQGKEVHAHILRSGFVSDDLTDNALLDMYAKCGSIDDAQWTFDKMPNPDVVSWNSLIAGYGKHGRGKEALQLFQQMQQAGMKPNDITFVCVLSACSHAGLVDEGWHLFESMNENHCIKQTAKHYACMVDLLGRSGRLHEAYNLINEMPFEQDVAVVAWGALLGACRLYSNVDLGKHVAERIFELEPQKAGTYVTLSNIYANAGMWDNVAKVRKMMKDVGVKKEPGCTWIVVKNRVHVFIMGDRSHPQTEEIYSTLEILAGQLKEAGYVFDTNFVLLDVEEQHKEHIICCHSERLAIAFGLISTLPGTPIRIVKNLRVCGDCHTATKFISKIVGREIVARDANRFHHFIDGLCSCGDYW
eukprot:Gb_36081 [translate_table: standard]